MLLDGANGVMDKLEVARASECRLLRLDPTNSPRMKFSFRYTFGSLAAATLLVTSSHAATTVTRYDENGTGSPFTLSFHPGAPPQIIPGGVTTIPGPPIPLPGGGTMPGSPIVIPNPPIIIPGMPAIGFVQTIDNARFALGSDSEAFTSGTDLTYTTGAISVQYMYGSAPQNGATFSPDSTLNFMGVSLDGDEIYESVAQFFLSANSNPRLLAIATNDDNTPMSISQGYAVLVPEPSGLALAALSLASLLGRRRR